VTPSGVHGLVFAGGASERMGQDKAMLDVGGRPLIAVVLDALSGLDTVTVVGGDEATFSSFQVGWCADETPGQGPLGALLSGWHAIGADVVVAAACDLPSVNSETVSELVRQRATTDADLCVPLIGGQKQWHLAAWATSALPSLERAYSNGERSLRHAALGLKTIAVVLADAAVFSDVDTPDDLTRHHAQ
jgi:molybdopterin-guanine dinucleotide biosynthesis protein A